LIEFKYEPTSEQEGFFDFVRGDSFPWFLLRTLNDDHSPHQFCHALMKRDASGEPVEGRVNSQYYEYARNIFLDVCAVGGVEVNEIYRLAFNCTTYSQQRWVDPHKDHEFDHKVLIMYLNKFTYGQTFLMDDDKKVVETILPEKYKAVIFDNCYHTHTFCEPDELRIVMVATFI
jgi:hypothetical protein